MAGYLLNAIEMLENRHTELPKQQGGEKMRIQKK